MAQINALVRHDEIVGDDKVTAPHLNGKWMSVHEFVGQTEQNETGSPLPSQRSAAKTLTPGHAASAPIAPASVPPRPDERTLTSITAPSHQNEPRIAESDAVHDLFEILQAARDRKTQTPASAGASTAKNEPIEMPRPVNSSSGSPLLWFAVPAAVVVAIVLWKFQGTNTPSEPIAEHGNEAVTAQAPATPSASAHTAHVSPPPAKAVASLPSGFSAGRQPLHPVQANRGSSDREKERELERQREREAERELEREREREAELARNYSSDEPSAREKEREKEREAERTAASATHGSPADTPLVTGGIPADPGAFRNMAQDINANTDSEDSGKPHFPQTP